MTNTQNEVKVQDHIEIHDRGEDRKAASSGRVLFVKNGDLYSIDDTNVVDNYLGVEDGAGTTALSPTLGSWDTADSTRPVWLEVNATVETDGASAGHVVIDVDEDGGTTADYSVNVAFVASDNATGTQDKGYAKVYLPKGAQYQVRSVSDPNGANAVGDARQITA